MCGMAGVLGHGGSRVGRTPDCVVRVTPRSHVVVLMATGRLGGAERSMVSLIKSTTAALRFTLLLPEFGELGQVAAAAGVDALVIPWPRRVMALGERSGLPRPTALLRAVPAFWSAVARLAAHVESLRPDVFVTNGIKPHVMGALALRRFPRLPLVWYLRDSLEGRRLSRAIFGRVSGRCDAAVAISEYVARDATTYLPRALRPEVVYNILGVPLERECDDEPIQKPAGELWFATIGSLTPLKGHDVFLKAAAVVSRERPEARFLIAGSNQYAPERGLDYPGQLRALASRLRLDPVVRFLGQRRDVQRLLRQIDVVVQCNTAPEAFGRSVAEAMRAGLPVIASRGWSFPELIEDGRTGWLVTPGDVQALADRMMTAAIDPGRRQDIGERARAFITSITDPSSCAAAFEAALARAAGRRSQMLTAT
jgi:glycosyltransferase involved in cell wall biosynthesis